MLKFIKHHMESIDGIAIYPIISFVIFFSLFVGVLIWVIRKDRQTVEALSQIPLDQPKSLDHEKA